MTYLSDFFALFFPRLCPACHNALLKHEEVLCTLCLFQLPKTGFHLLPDNPLCTMFWGRVPLAHVAACCFFRKGGRVQRLIHLLKYHGRQDIGHYMGRMYGQQLRLSGFYDHTEVIVPVPLHPKKKRKRGYNQSECIACGLAESLQIPIDCKTLIRTTASESQTRKSRYGRWENVKEIFAVSDLKALEHKHILLVDDVLTTGSTIEACAAELLKIKGVKISVATLACVIR